MFEEEVVAFGLNPTATTSSECKRRSADVVGFDPNWKVARPKEQCRPYEFEYNS